MTDSPLPAVLANPHDVAPRLIYADWLEEHGQQERAEFIRVQIELAWLGEPPFPNCHSFAINMRPREQCLRCVDCKKQTALRARERELLRKGEFLFPELPYISGLRIQGGYEDDCRIMCAPRCGCVEVMRCTWTNFAAHQQAIRQACPLTEVELTTRPGHTFTDSGNAKLEGCEKWHWIPRGEEYDHSPDGIKRMLLAAEFPGLTFRFVGER